MEGESARLVKTIEQVREALEGWKADAERYWNSGEPPLQRAASGYLGAVARIKSVLDDTDPEME